MGELLPSGRIPQARPSIALLGVRLLTQDSALEPPISWSRPREGAVEISSRCVKSVTEKVAAVARTRQLHCPRALSGVDRTACTDRANLAPNIRLAGPLPGLPSASQTTRRQARTRTGL